MRAVKVMTFGGTWYACRYCLSYTMSVYEVNGWRVIACNAACAKKAYREYHY